MPGGGVGLGQELYLDATKIAANADLDSLQRRFAVEAHLAQLFAADDADDNGDERHGAAPEAEEGDAAAMLPIDLMAPARADLAAQATARRDGIGRAGRPDRTHSRGSYRRTADFRVSTTDPDATPMRTGSGTALGHHDHDVVDGGKARIILAALVTPADVMENVPLRDLLWRVCFRRKLRPGQVVGDTTYGTVENIVALEDAGIQAVFPLPDFDRRSPFFGRDQFALDAAADLYSCPAGQILRFRKAKHTDRVRIYQAPAARRDACPLKAQCTDSVNGRQIKRNFDEADLDKVRGYHGIAAYQKAMRKRQVWVKPLFAEAKLWHGLRRFRLRGLRTVTIEGLVVAAGQNLKRFLARQGGGDARSRTGRSTSSCRPSRSA